jgi:hypothetical protein
MNDYLNPSPLGEAALPQYSSMSRLQQMLQDVTVQRRPHTQQETPCQLWW